MAHKSPECLWFLEDDERKGKVKPTLEYKLRPLRVEMDAIRPGYGPMMGAMTRIFGEPCTPWMRMALKMWAGPRLLV